MTEIYWFFLKPSPEGQFETDFAQKHSWMNVIQIYKEESRPFSKGRVTYWKNILKSSTIEPLNPMKASNNAQCITE